MDGIIRVDVAVVVAVRVFIIVAVRVVVNADVTWWVDVTVVSITLVDVIVVVSV